MKMMSELVLRAQRGEQAAWDELYEQTEREAYFVARKVCRRDEDAKDLVQEAYLKAFMSLNQLEEPEKFRSWLNMIVANKCLDYLRKNKPLLFSELSKEDGEEWTADWEDDRSEVRPDKELDHKETVRLVAEMIEDLPEDQKLCIILYYREELSVSEIAQALQVSEGTVKSRLNYARQKVKKKVEELERQGVKLYGMAPLPFLAWLLEREASGIQVPKVLVGTAAGTKASATAASSNSGKAAATAGAKGVLTGTLAKVVAGAVAAGVAVTGITTLVRPEAQETPLPSPVASIVEEDEGTADKARAAYEQLLQTGVTERGLLIEYYAYLDLNQDEIPELLVADNNGSYDTMTSGELYCYADEALTFCGQIGSRYEPLYLVNDNTISGQARKGRCYLSLDGFLGTTMAHWNEVESRSAPATYHYAEDGSGNSIYEYITQEEFEYYNWISSEAPGEESFVQTAETIALERNIDVQDISVEVPPLTIHFPRQWRDKFVYEFGQEGSNCLISVYEKDTYTQVPGMGHLFSIMRYEDGEDYSYLPNYWMIGSRFSKIEDSYHLVMIFPSDVQCLPETQEHYLALNEDMEWIFTHLQWN